MLFGGWKDVGGLDGEGWIGRARAGGVLTLRAPDGELDKKIIGTDPEEGGVEGDPASLVGLVGVEGDVVAGLVGTFSFRVSS